MMRMVRRKRNEQYCENDAKNTKFKNIIRYHQLLNLENNVKSVSEDQEFINMSLFWTISMAHQT